MNTERAIEAIVIDLNSYIATAFAQHHLSGAYDVKALKSVITEKLTIFGDQKVEEQFEKDCNIVCITCAFEGLPTKNKDQNKWYHSQSTSQYPIVCSASNMRYEREKETRILNR